MTAPISVEIRGGLTNVVVVDRARVPVLIVPSRSTDDGVEYPSSHSRLLVMVYVPTTGKLAKLQRELDYRQLA